MWFLLAGAHQGKLYPAKFGGHKHSGSGDMLYVYYVILSNDVTNTCLIQLL